METDDELVIEKQRKDQIVILKLAGSVGATTFESLDKSFEDLFKHKQFRIIVNMANVRQVSSAGAGALMNAYDQCREHGGKLVLACLQEDVSDIIEMLNLNVLVPVVKTMDEAQANFNA